MNPILLLHGALGSGEQLNPLRNLLQPSWDVHVLTFEGHGQRSSDKPFSIALFAHNLKQYLDEQRLQKVVVFGYSMGGYVALKLAHQYPEYFSTIITLGTKFNWTPDSAAQEVKMLNPDKILEKVPGFAKALQQLHGEENWRLVMQKTATMMLALGSNNALRDSDFGQIQIPCHIGVGGLDAMVTRQETESTAAKIPGAQFYLLPNAPHPIDKLDFEEIAELIHKKTAAE